VATSLSAGTNRAPPRAAASRLDSCEHESISEGIWLVVLLESDDQDADRRQHADLLRASAEVLDKGAFGMVCLSVMESGVVVAVSRSSAGAVQQEMVSPLRPSFSEDEARR
jgi:hypothetical protein